MVRCGGRALSHWRALCDEPVEGGRGGQGDTWSMKIKYSRGQISVWLVSWGEGNSEEVFKNQNDVVAIW